MTDWPVHVLISTEPQVFSVEIVEEMEAEDTHSGAAVFNTGAVEVCQAKD